MSIRCQSTWSKQALPPDPPAVVNPLNSPCVVQCNQWLPLSLELPLCNAVQCSHVLNSLELPLCNPALNFTYAMQCNRKLSKRETEEAHARFESLDKDGSGSESALHRLGVPMEMQCILLQCWCRFPDSRVGCSFGQSRAPPAARFAQCKSRRRAGLPSETKKHPTHCSPEHCLTVPASPMFCYAVRTPGRKHHCEGRRAS